MIIIYNPPNGSLIESFRHQRVGELAPHPVGELKYYDEDVAKELLNTFAFLKELAPPEALKVKEEANYIKCEECEATFKPEAKSALEAHMKIHQEKQAVTEDLIDIPVAEATPVQPNKSASQRTQDSLHPILDDTASDPSFYGPGLTEEKSPRVRKGR